MTKEKIENMISQTDRQTDRQTEHELTGFPSIDKPWLKYYSEEAIQAELYRYVIWKNLMKYILWI